MTTLRHRMLEFAKRAEPPAAEADAPVESRVRRFIASSEAVDSYNTVIKANAWDLTRFEKNPVIFFGHRSRELPIGKGSAGVESKQLMLDVNFFSAELNPLADQSLRILDTGVMGVSVGFEPLTWEYNSSRETGDEWQDFFFPPLDYTSVRLLEVSVVSIPANPDAFPVGRDAVQARFLERLDARRAPPPVVIPPPSVIAETPAKSPEDFRSMVERITREEKQALVARRSGKTSRSRP